MDAKAALKELAEPLGFGDRTKTAIARAARRAGLSYWRAFDIWYGKARRLEEYEREQLASAIEKKRKEASRNELHELRTRLARLEALLMQTDAEFHRETIDHLRERDGGPRGVGRPLARKT